MDGLARIAEEVKTVASQLQAISGRLAAMGEAVCDCDGALPLAVEFRLPMLNLHKAWYEATRKYGEYRHHPPAEDWNLETGANTDLGEPLVAPFSGLVISAHDWRGGTGRIVQILGLKPTSEMIVWSGWHLHTMRVDAGQVVVCGEEIGTIGNADGRYAGAHLHEQICVVNAWGIPKANAYVSDPRYDWRRPSDFYIEHGVDPELVRRVAALDGV